MDPITGKTLKNQCYMSDEDIVQSYKNAIDFQEQITILSQLTLKSEIDIIKILNRHGIDTCNIKASKRKRYNECDWKGADGNRAKKLKSLGYTYTEIADMMDLSYSHIARFFHLYCNNKIHKKWTKTEVDTLMELRSQGLSFSEIAAIIGKTASAVCSQWHYHKEKEDDWQ